VDPAGSGVLELKEGRPPPMVQFRVAPPYPGKWQGFTRAEGMGSHEIRGLVTDARGNLWVATHDGLSSFDGSSWETFGKANGFGSSDILQLLACRSGEFWVGTADDLRRFDPHHPGSAAAAQILKQGALTALLETHSGEIWGAFSENGVARFDGRTWTDQTAALGLGAVRVACLLEDSQNRLWFGTADGLILLQGDRSTHFDASHMLSGKEVGCLLEDKEGRIWAGTHNGLNCFDGQQWRAANGGPSLERIPVLFEDHQHQLWAGSEANGLSRFADGHWQHYGESEGLAGNTVTLPGRRSERPTLGGH
jgi:ligand-binding sensor domain-containing protein